MRWVAALAVCLVVATSARADWSVRRDPFDPNVVARYKAILARDPYDDGALRQLVALYRGFRTVAKLEAEYRAQGESWAALVVLARMPTGDAEALWKRAVALKPDDARAWIAIGDTAKTDRTTATDAYRRAANVAATPRDKRAALTKLVGAARDPAAIDGAYAELVALSPKDGMLWLERGNAQLAAKQHADARTSFATAESLLAGDPERRLTAMTNQGIAIERLGQPDDAIAQYEHTLAKVPTGYYLGQELVTRIVDVERKRGRLGAAIERFEKRWPARSRGYFEWALLGDLYAETHDEERALAAYKAAVVKSPVEVATQRKLIALLDKLRPDEALAQHAAAARVAPGDAPLQLELAKRYFPSDEAKAFATLDALARRSPNDVGVRGSIAELYDAWNQPLRAIVQYEAIAKLEPGDPEHAIVLGEAYWSAGQTPKAFAAWARLDKIGTPDALHRHGEVLAIHAAWEPAARAYSSALARDATRLESLYGRARAYEALRRFPEAAADARRAVALTSDAQLDNGRRGRSLLVRVLEKNNVALADAIARWRFAFDHGDVGAGYLLAMHHGRLGSRQHHELLVELYRRVPTDDSLGMELARSYVRRQELARARLELERIAQRTPSLVQEIQPMLDHIEELRARAELEIRLAEAGRSGRATHPEIVDLKRRIGVRVELGTDVAKASGALGGFGVYHDHRVGRGLAWEWRLDWTERDDDLLEQDAIAVAATIAKRVADTRRFELAAGLGPRFELRWGEGIPSATFDRAAIGVEATVSLLPRAVPAMLDLRFHHSLTDASRSSSLLVELGFELR